MEQELLFRIVVFVIFLSSLATTAWFRGRARQTGEVIPRLAEGLGALVGRIAIGLTLLSFIVLYTFRPEWLAWGEVALPNWIRWLGVAFGLLCPLLAAWTLRALGSNISETVLTKSDQQLVTHGPYQWVRHPLYTVGLLFILSFGLIASNGAVLILGVVVALVMRLVVIPAEERNLVDKFGERYEQYRRHTGTLLPGV